MGAQGLSAQPDLIDRLRLIRTPGIGPIAYRQLLLRFGSAAAALDAIPDLARRGGGKVAGAIREGQGRARDRGGREARRALPGRSGRGSIRARWPSSRMRRRCSSPRATSRLLERPMVAIVGARNASAAACRFARGLAHDLGQEGVAVVSGLARGIDSAAHDGSLDSGTIAVIAGGIDIFYPPENEARQDDIAERGLLIAEMPPGTEPRARHFPYRNRIIAGLAAGTVVVEAAPQSGSLITARLAAEAGREVMAVPGSPLDPRAQGCNQLIRDGATLVQTAADVIEGASPAGREGRQPAARHSTTSRSRARPMPSRRSASGSRNCSGRRRCRSTRSSACQGREPARCSWSCSSSTSPAGSTAMPGTRSASTALDGPEAATRQSRVRT